MKTIEELAFKFSYGKANRHYLEQDCIAFGKLLQREIRDAALEEAAVRCENHAYLAGEIRALKSKPVTP